VHFAIQEQYFTTLAAKRWPAQTPLAHESHKCQMPDSSAGSIIGLRLQCDAACVLFEGTRPRHAALTQKPAPETFSTAKSALAVADLLAKLQFSSCSDNGLQFLLGSIGDPYGWWPTVPPRPHRPSVLFGRPGHFLHQCHLRFSCCQGVSKH
jgi:hypothetical protein